jgi:formate hydrogenlyase subunit 6/NADH:ubiquinone oxidoreductase subunit I
MKTYFKNIGQGISTTLTGMRLTMRHLRQARSRRKVNNIQKNDYFAEHTGMVTLQYPHETMAVPDNGRYQLHNEMDDCIVCDKCVKICPVDCIEIEPIRSSEEIGKASDGSSIRLYAAKFDIDMAKCCYCGLCTTVCPTECLTMTQEFDYSTFDIKTMLFQFGNLTPAQAEEKRQLWEQYQAEKAAAAISKQLSVEPKHALADEVKHALAAEAEIETKPEAPKRPVFVPRAKPQLSPEVQSLKFEEPKIQDTEPKPQESAPKRPVFRPTMKPKE